jgi:hypothetical protein
MRYPRVATIAFEQDGLITRAQALACGMSPDAVRHAIGPEGRWQVTLPGLYATFDGPLGRQQHLRAAVLHGGVGSVITGVAACRLTGLRYVPARAGIDVLVPHRHRPGSTSSVHVHRTTRMPDRIVWWTESAKTIASRWWSQRDDVASTAWRGMVPIAPPARAAVDAVRLHSASLGRHSDLAAPQRIMAVRDVRALMCEVVQRRRCNVSDLLTEIDAAPRAGMALARLAIADVVAGCRSAPECELRDIVRSSRVLPEPRWNRPLPGYPSISPDACWPLARLVAEVNSREWHGFGVAPEETERRHALYAGLGWTVFPVSPHRIRSDPGGVRRQLVAAYRAGLER